MVFRKMGFDAVPAPADFIASGAGYSWYSFLPQAENLATSTNAIKEWIGMAAYGAAGWL